MNKTLELESQFQQSSLSGKKNWNTYVLMRQWNNSWVLTNWFCYLLWSKYQHWCPQNRSSKPGWRAYLDQAYYHRMTWEDSVGNDTPDNPQQPSLSTVHNGTAQNLAEHSVPTQPGPGLIWSVMEADRGGNWSKPISVSLSHLMSHCKTTTKPWLRYCCPTEPCEGKYVRKEEKTKRHPYTSCKNQRQRDKC